MSAPAQLRSVHGTLTISMESALLIGGYADPGTQLDATTARDGEGRLIVPASALKGALREACIRLAAAQGHMPCALSVPLQPCDAASPCIICQLFGTPGPHRPGLTVHEDEAPPDDVGKAGGLRFRDAVLRGRARDLLSSRFGVAIDRQTGAASQEVLFLRELLDAPGTSLTALLQGEVSEAAWNLFTQALTLVTGIGNSRTRGLGQVRVSFTEGRQHEPPSVAPLQCARDLGDAELALVVIEPLEPLVLGQRQESGTVHETLRYVPGSTLRGALANAVLRWGVQNTAPVFRHAFVDSETWLRFSDARPARTRDRTLPLPLPLTTLRCKNHEDRRHHKGEVLHDFAIRMALAQKILQRGGVWLPPTCRSCGEPLKHEEGTFPICDPQRRIVTRVGRDVRTGSAMPGLLYSVEQVLPGTGFIGTVAGLTAEARELLEQAGEIFVGQGRSRGQGRVAVRLESASHLVGERAVARRRESFVKAVAPLLALAGGPAQGLPEDPLDLVAVVARTDLDLVSEGTSEDATAELARCIFGTPDAEVLLVRLTIGRRTGWDEMQGRARPLKQVVRAGAVWIFRCPPGHRPVTAHLAGLETSGVGNDRELGLGQIIFYPDILLKGWTS